MPSVKQPRPGKLSGHFAADPGASSGPTTDHSTVTRTLPHLRVGLYGDCNFRCTYCPPWGENSYRIAENLSFAELMNVLYVLAQNRFKVVKLTGGEPTLRRDIVDIVGATSKIFPEVRLITNGWNLAKISKHLAAAGLGMVELSIDSLDAEGFDNVTQTRRLLPKVLAGLETCLDLGIKVQINMVVMRQNLDQIDPMIDLIAARGPIRLKLLELVYYQYPGLDYWKANFVGMREITPRLKEKASDVTWETPPGAFGTPMRVYQLQNGSSIVVKDGRLGAVYADICDGCPLFPCQDGLYGLSLTSDGMLKMCKHRPDLHVTVRGVNVPGGLQEAVTEVIRRYDSAYFLADGWEPGTMESGTEAHIVAPDDAVLRWYRRNGRVAGTRSPVAAQPETIPAGQSGK